VQRHRVGIPQHNGGDHDPITTARQMMATGTSE
jgi:hypothetical protein